MSVIGKRIKIVNPTMTFGDYEMGDTGVVTHEYEGIGVHVIWDERRFDDDETENSRCLLVAYREFEMIKEET